MVTGLGRLPRGAHQAGLLPRARRVLVGAGVPRHGERSRLQLLLKLAGTVTSAFTLWLFNLAVPVHLRVF